jgi:hypothetical protein
MDGKPIREGDLVNLLMDFNARLMRRNLEDQRELRRLTSLALELEQRRRKRGNGPGVPIGVPTADGQTSEAAE